MKKFLYVLMVSFTIVSFFYTDTIFAQSEISNIYTYNKDALVEHISVIEKYQDGVYLLSKNALNDACTNPDKDKIQNYLKDISYLSQQISSRSKAINSQCKMYDPSDPLLGDLLILDTILCEYKIALLHLYQYLTIENMELQYKSIQSFFSITTDANKKLSLIKDSIM